MNKVTVCKAGDVAGRGEVEMTVIEVSLPLPSIRSPKGDGTAEAAFESNARGIARALCASLPQATLRRLIAILLAQSAGSYRGTDQ